jgi:hypothetical protein
MPYCHHTSSSYLSDMDRACDQSREYSETVVQHYIETLYWEGKTKEEKCITRLYSGNFAIIFLKF